MHRILSVIVVAACATAPALHAQHKPDFTGTWALDTTRSAPEQQSPEVVRPRTVVITQTDDSVVMTTLREGRGDVVIFTTGPAPSGTTPDRHGMIITWEGQSLRTMFSRTISDAPVNVSEERELTAGGKEMVVRRQLAVQHGYQSGDNTSDVVTDVYVKQAPRP